MLYVENLKEKKYSNNEYALYQSIPDIVANEERGSFLLKKVVINECPACIPNKAESEYRPETFKILNAARQSQWWTALYRGERSRGIYTIRRIS